jgi:HYR domain.
VGVTTNTFRATDAAGNTALCTFTVTVNDTQNPVITCPTNIIATTPIGSCVAVVNYTVTATDNCPGVTTALQSGLASGSSFPLGVSTVTWRATDASGNTATCSFTVTVLDGQLPVISQQPANTTSCVGSNVTFTVVSSNVLTYQWQTFSGGSWNNIPGATSSTYTVNNVQTSMNTNTFRVILNGLCTTVTSNTATLFVNTLPIITLSSSRPPFLLPGQFLDITATGIPPGGSFVWLKNGVVIAGATGNTISNLGVDDQGSYTVRYTDPNGCISTSAALVVSGMFSDNMWVYPNPNFGQFQVRFFNQNPENATVNVFNSAGAKVYQKSLVTTLPYTMIDINLGSTAADGVYFVELVNQAGKRVGAKQVVVRKR